jgi:hypothetical protein
MGGLDVKMPVRVIKLVCLPSLVVASFFIFASTGTLCAEGQNGNVIVSSGPSGDLILSGKHGNAYKDIVFKDRSGVIHKLFQGRYTYEDEGSKALSPDKKFYMVTQNESGVATSGSGASEEHEVSSCAFIDTRNGCVVKKETGEYCGGTWSGDHGWPRLDGEIRPIDSSVPSASKLLSAYKNSIQTQKEFKSFIKYGVTVDNIMSCDPVKSNNKDSYKEIANALDRVGDVKDADGIKRAMQAVSN